jgi:hypothetical protein
MTTIVDWGNAGPEEWRRLNQIAGRLAIACYEEGAHKLWAAEMHNVVEQYGPLTDDFFAMEMAALSALAVTMAKQVTEYRFPNAGGATLRDFTAHTIRSVCGVP